MLEILGWTLVVFIVVTLITAMFLFVLYAVERFVVSLPGIIQILADLYGRIKYPHQYRPPTKTS